MPWFVVCIKPKYDKIVTEALEKKEVVCYCPYYESIRQWTDRKKKIYVPLFVSYMFVQLEDYSQEKNESVDRSRCVKVLMVRR